MSNCIFCKIAAGEIPSIKIWEDEHYLAILDIFPNTKGQTLVISKIHQDSNIANIEESTAALTMIATQKVIKLLKKGLEIERVGVVIEGLEINHLHVRLYPFFSDKGFEHGISAGPKADPKDLENIAHTIKERNK